MPSLSNVIGQASRGADLYFVFRFLRLLTMKYTSTNAYKLGIIDKKGKALKKSADLETVKEKSSYTMLHRMVFKIRGLLEKIPIVGKTILLNYAAALFLLKEQKDTRIWTDDGYMKRKLMEFLETDWEADAKFLKEEVDNMNRKSFSTFLAETKLEESQELQAMMALDDAGIEAVINRKGQIVINKKDLKNAQKAFKKSFRKGGAPELKTEEVELEEENKYDMFDDKPAQELDKEMKKAMKMKSYEVARAHIGDFLIKLDKKYPKSGVLDTEPRSIVTDMLNKKFRTKHKLHYAADSDELKFMKRKPPPSLRSLNIMRSEEVEEGIDIKKASMGDVIKDFQKSDAPQFKGKSDKKKKEMAVAAKLAADEVDEELANVAPTAPDSGGIQYQAPVLGKKKKKKRELLKGAGITEEVQRTTFAGKDVFIVDSETFYNCRLGKKKYGRYEKYVGDGLVGQTIREYGLKYPRRPIILQNGESGPMLYLKYGRS